MLDQLIVVSVVSLLLLVVAGVFRLRKQTTPGTERKSPTPTEGVDTVLGWPPQAARILSTPERNAHDLLIRALPGYMIFAQLPLSRFIKVPTRYSYAQWLRRVGSHCVDFVIADPLSRVIAVIEIRAAYTPEKLLRRHERVARVLETASIPMYEWIEGDLPNLAKIRDLFKLSEAEALKPASQGVSPAAIVPAPLVDPATVNFYIANEALPEFAPAQPHDVLVDEPLPEVTELPMGETEGLFAPVPVALAKEIDHLPFSLIDLDLPERLPLASPATAPSAEVVAELPLPTIEESTTLTLMAPTISAAQARPEAGRETVLVERLLHEESVIDQGPASFVSEPLEGVPSLEHPPTTWFSEFDTQAAPLSSSQHKEATLASDSEHREAPPSNNWPPIVSAPA